MHVVRTAIFVCLTLLWQPARLVVLHKRLKTVTKSIIQRCCFRIFVHQDFEKNFHSSFVAVRNL